MRFYELDKNGKLWNSYTVKKMEKDRVDSNKNTGGDTYETVRKKKSNHGDGLI